MNREDEDRPSEATSYGILLASIKSMGAVYVDGQKTDCAAFAFQVQSGQVWVTLFSRSEFYPSNPANIEGVTRKGSAFIATGLQKANYLFSTEEPGSYLAFSAQHLQVTSSPDSSSWSRFSVVNLALSKRETTAVHPLGKAILRQIDGYDSVITRLQVVKDISITAHIDVYAGSIDDRIAIANDICCLLSLGRGTKVVWISRIDYLESESQEVSRVHASAVTKRYAPYPVIDPRPAAENDTDSYLEQSLPVFVQRRDAWGLSKGVIDAFLDAKAESDYLQMRGVKLVVAMEMLKTSFLKATESRDVIMSQDEFTALYKNLSRPLRNVLQGFSLSSTDRALFYRNAKGINRRPFSEILSSLCSYLGVNISEIDLRLFVKSRNALVHSASFYSQTATKVQMLDFGLNGEPFREFLRLLNIMDRMYLKAVGYSGPYLDCQTWERTSI